MNSIGPLADLNLRALFQAYTQELMTTLNCHQVGQIQSFDAATQTATVRIMMQRQIFNQPQTAGEQLQLTPLTIDYPVLVDCPVFVYGGGGRVLTIPVKEGDSCLVLFNDRDIGSWFSTGSASKPETLRTHSLADGLVLVGFRNLQNPVEDFSEDAVELRNDDEGSKISLDDKVGISNESTSLKTALDSLMTALLAWVNTGGTTPNPATVLALTNVKTTLDSLLK